MITDICVLLLTADREEALVWGADRTTWNEDTGTILFTPFEGETIELVDGQEVMFGGGGLSVAEDPDFDGILAGIDWVSEPDPTCARESWWLVETSSPRALLAVEELVELGEVDAGIEIRREQANDRRLRPR